MNENAVTAEEIEQYLDSQSDFSLEMKVFSHLLSLGFHAEQGGTYSDPVTDKPRQFDIRCKIRNDNEIVKLAVECKALSPQFPLVIQQVPRIEKESYHELFWSYEPPKNKVRVGLLDSSKALRTRSTSQLYKAGKSVGKSSNQHRDLRLPRQPRRASSVKLVVRKKEKIQNFMLMTTKYTINGHRRSHLHMI